MPRSQHNSANARWWASLKSEQRAELERLAQERRIARLNAKLDEAAIMARLKAARGKRARRIAQRRAAHGMPPLALV